jgi:hypothetical protein
LQLYTAYAEELPLKYTLEIRPIYESWEMGTGKYSNSPTTTNGVSWVYRDGITLGTTWSIDNLPENVTSSYFAIDGGSNWYYNLGTTISTNYSSTDINVDITDIFSSWVTSSIENNGIIIKRSYKDETSTEYQGKLQFFSRESNTIYSPVLRFKYDDSIYTTGSLLPIDISIGDIIVYAKNKKVYKEGEIARIDVKCRYKYPNRTFSTESMYKTSYYLPTSSYYQISDYITGDKIIDFDDNYTKLSCDSNGNYFTLRTNNFMLNRFYKISLKVVDSDTLEEVYYDDEFTFKVVK